MGLKFKAIVASLPPSLLPSPGSPPVQSVHDKLQLLDAAYYPDPIPLRLLDVQQVTCTAEEPVSTAESELFG